MRVLFIFAGLFLMASGSFAQSVSEKKEVLQVVQQSTRWPAIYCTAQSGFNLYRPPHKWAICTGLGQQRACIGRTHAGKRGTGANS
jgi:hypothetical protein